MKIEISREQLGQVLRNDPDKTAQMILNRLKAMVMQRGPHSIEIGQ